MNKYVLLDLNKRNLRVVSSFSKRVTLINNYQSFLEVYISKVMNKRNDEKALGA